MKKHGLLLERHTGRRRPHEHEASRDDPVELPLVLGRAGVHLLEREVVRVTFPRDQLP
jgi:hypothetical protein